MNVESFYLYVVSKPGAEETFPFGQDVLVMKVGGKMFALIDPDDVPARANLKCEPERAIELREEYEGIIPGWHMNKKTWNTVYLDSDVPDPLIRELIDHSYDLILESLPEAKRPG
jgi:predicted DNA-binding protein (MmcQ/YjbR family)